MTDQQTSRTNITARIALTGMSEAADWLAKHHRDVMLEMPTECFRAFDRARFALALFDPIESLDMKSEAEMARAYYEALQTHLRDHGCDHDFAEVANND